jgi:hypothetical protein
MKKLRSSIMSSDDEREVKQPSKLLDPTNMSNFGRNSKLKKSVKDVSFKKIK